MKVIDTLMLSTRMFTTRAMRTFLTILGVSIGIGAVLFLVSLGYGIQNVILSQITTADSLLSLDVTAGSSGLVTINDESIGKIGSYPEVTEISRLKNISGQISYGELTGGGIFQAIDPSFFRLHGVTADHGTLFSETKNEVVISSAMATLFNVTADEILGESVRLTTFIQREDEDGFEDVEIAEQPEPFTVVGVVEDDNSSYLYVPISSLSTEGIDSYDLIKVKLSDESHSASVENLIIEQGFLVSSLSDIIDQANKIFRIIQIVLGLFGLIALIVSAIGMFNTMTIALLERTNEIGIMRSIGVTRRDVRMMFLVESMIMGFMGGVGGVLLGYLAGEIANFGFNALARSLGGRAFDLFIQPAWFIFVIIGFSTVIGFLTGVFPSRRAAKMDPLEALRYK